MVHTGGADGGADVNAIPASAVERIEVLTVGASSVYGSDAIAGVVNFIMRKDFDGMQASIDYGISSRQDGQRTGGSLTFGQAGEKGNVIAGVNYNKFDGILSGDRDYSKVATYLYAGSAFSAGGSSRNPRGFISLPDDNPTAIALGCTTVTRIPGASGASTSDYRCYRERRFQLPGGEPGADAAGAHQRVLPGQLPDRGRRQRLPRGLPQQDRLEFRPCPCCRSMRAPTR